MARNDDPWKKFRDKEDERTPAQSPPERLGDPKVRLDAPPSPARDNLDPLIRQAEPLIEQLNNLYNQFIAGVDSRPPLETRKRLDSVMQQLQAVPKPTPANQFRYQTLQTRYLSHVDRWERLMRDLESGKIQRRISGKSSS